MPLEGWEVRKPDEDAVAFRWVHRNYPGFEVKTVVDNRGNRNKYSSILYYEGDLEEVLVASLDGRPVTDKRDIKSATVAWINENPDPHITRFMDEVQELIDDGYVDREGKKVMVKIYDAEFDHGTWEEIEKKAQEIYGVGRYEVDPSADYMVIEPEN